LRGVVSKLPAVWGLLWRLTVLCPLEGAESV
jgi:hypothetical protein